MLILGNSTNTTTEQDLENDVMQARFVIGLSSGAMVMIVLACSIYFKAWTAPRFIWSQLLAIGLCNLGGVIISCSLISSDFYTSNLTFGW